MFLALRFFGGGTRRRSPFGGSAAAVGAARPGPRDRDNILLHNCTSFTVMTVLDYLYPSLHRHLLGSRFAGPMARLCPATKLDRRANFPDHNAYMHHETNREGNAYCEVLQSELSFCYGQKTPSGIHRYCCRTARHTHTHKDPCGPKFLGPRNREERLVESEREIERRGIQEKRDRFVTDPNLFLSSSSLLVSTDSPLHN